MVDAEFHLCSCQLGRLYDVSQPTTPSCPMVVAVGTFQSAHGKASMRECLRLSDIRSRAGCPSMRTIVLLDYDDVDCAAQCGRIYRVPALGDDAGDRAHVLHGFCSRPRPSSLCAGYRAYSATTAGSDSQFSEAKDVQNDVQNDVAGNKLAGVREGDESWDGNHSQCMRPAAGVPPSSPRHAGPLRADTAQERKLSARLTSPDQVCPYNPPPPSQLIASITPTLSRSCRDSAGRGDACSSFLSPRCYPNPNMPSTGRLMSLVTTWRCSFSCPRAG
jgi:hypothetical protein